MFMKRFLFCAIIATFAVIAIVEDSSAGIFRRGRCGGSARGGSARGCR
jgi:hypothetical protein